MIEQQDFVGGRIRSSKTQEKSELELSELEEDELEEDELEEDEPIFSQCSISTGLCSNGQLESNKGFQPCSAQNMVSHF